MEFSPALEDCQLVWGTKMGAWITMFPFTVNGMDLGDQEWSDSLYLHYCIYTPDFPTHCNGFNFSFSICYALDYNKGGLIMTHCNDLCDGFADLSGKFFTPSHVRDDPLIYPGLDVREVKSQRTSHLSTIHLQLWRIWGRRGTL